MTYASQGAGNVTLSRDRAAAGTYSHALPGAIPARNLSMSASETYASEQYEPEPITDYAARRGE